MYQGIAFQVSHDLSGAPRTRQILVIPALSTVFHRTISEDKPRSRWNHRTFTAPTDLLGLTGLTAETVDSIRTTSGTYLVGLGHGFHVGDDEAAEVMATHELPRNVGLRYQRALDAAGVTLHGAGAKPSSDVRATATASFAFAGFAGHDALATLFTENVKQWQDRIAADDRTWLNDRTASEARGRGMGAHRRAWSGPMGIAVDPDARVKAEDVIRAALHKGAPAPAGAAAHGRVPVKVGAKVPLPMGKDKHYVARKVLGDVPLSDVDVLRTARDEQQHVLLYGPPGTGKTALAYAAHSDLIVVAATGDMEVADLVGMYVPTGDGDRFVFQDGPLVTAMLTGAALLVDEVSIMPPRTLAALLPALDSQRSIRITACPERGVIEAHPNFSVIFTSNPDAVGNGQISEAITSRMGLSLLMETDWDLATKLGVDRRLVQAAQHLAKSAEAGELAPSAVPQLRELLTFAQNQRTYGSLVALRALVSWAPAPERETVASVLRERFGDLPNAKQIRELRVD